MPTVDIAREEWGRALDDFSRRHAGRVVSLEVLDPEIGAQIAAWQLPLEGISRDARRDEIAVAIGDRTDDHVLHTIARPSRVFIKRSEEGFDQVLEIESHARQTLLRLA